jgi:hypothetical protein
MVIATSVGAAMANNAHVRMMSSPVPPINSPEHAEGRNSYLNAQWERQ